MGDVRHQVGSYRVANASKTSVIEVSWICRGTADNNLGLEFLGADLEGIVINQTSVFINLKIEIRIQRDLLHSRAWIRSISWKPRSSYRQSDAHELNDHLEQD